MALSRLGELREVLEELHYVIKMDEVYYGVLNPRAEKLLAHALKIVQIKPEEAPRVP